MRSFAATAIEIMGGIALGLCGSMPFWGALTPAESISNPVLTRKPVSHKIELETARGNAVMPTIATVADSLQRQNPTMTSTAESTLREKVALLARGSNFLQSVPSYTATLQKQEVVRGELLEEQTMSLKCRHQPFSIYLEWLTGDTGREVIYVEGRNDGKMIAHDGGWKARIPAFSLSTDCMLAMRDARYPVTTAGLLGLIEMMLDVHDNDLICANFASCDVNSNERFDGRPCYTFTTTYKSPQDSPIYRKSITMIDQEWNVPLQSRHFEWPTAGSESAETDTDKSTLIESYSFTKVEMGCHLTDHDFDRTNPEYHFR